MSAIPADWERILRNAAGEFNNENKNLVYVVREMCARIHATEDALEDPVMEAAPEMLAILDELESSFDEQTWDEKKREDFDAPDDREYSVNITAKQLRAISAAVTKATKGAKP